MTFTLLWWAFIAIVLFFAWIFIQLIEEELIFLAVIFAGLLIGGIIYLVTRLFNNRMTEETKIQFKTFFTQLKKKEHITPEDLGSNYLAVIFSEGKPFALIGKNGKNGNNLAYFTESEDTGAFSSIPLNTKEPLIPMNTYKPSDIRYAGGQFYQNGNYIHEKLIPSFKKGIYWIPTPNMWMDAIMLNPELTKKARQSGPLSDRYCENSKCFTLRDRVTVNYINTGAHNLNEVVVSSHSRGNDLIQQNNAMRNVEQTFLSSSTADSIVSWLWKNIKID